MTKSHEKIERTALYRLYSTTEPEGLPRLLDELYPRFLSAFHHLGTADSCPNGGPGITYGMWDFECDGGTTLVRSVEWGTPLTPVPTALYRLRDQSGTLLYVGITNNLGWRWKTHAADKEWWPEVVTRSIEWFPTRSHALAAEAAAIRAEQPLHNIQHNKASA
ncbi:GIY-YIG nuclease family protein [Streptomyces enissocaesilis]|uniref:GIY-YIG domain-containing protein n=1 Tax=Streptomyces enissocaesilis TaxID=332589 RepID=A0ABP6JDC3_9ACTN